MSTQQHTSELPGTRGREGAIIGKKRAVTNVIQNKAVGCNWKSEEGWTKITHADIRDAEGECLYLAIEIHSLNTTNSKKTKIGIYKKELAKVLGVRSKVVYWMVETRNLR